MYRCTECNEETAFEFFDSYDDEIYIKCGICGKIQTKASFTEAVHHRKINIKGMRKL